MPCARAALTIGLVLALAGTAVAQETALAPDADAGATAPAEPDAPAFNAEQVEQMLAPIALYPDALLMQILMSSTYPLEIVAADRWAKKNTTITGDAIEKAVEAQTWDPSVKSMIHFPTVLARMSENLDWTQDLGDAFLAQQDQVLDTIQKLRKEAYDAGNLKSGEEQTVVVEKETQIIQIEPAQPQVVYVPQYTTAVYGAPPPATSYYPTVNTYSGTDMAVASVLSFGVGMAMGAAIWGGDCDWDDHHVYGGWGGGDADIDIERNVNISGNEVNIGNRNRESWQHNPAHRGGVRYRDDKTRSNFAGKEGARPSLSRDAARGYSNSTLGSSGRASGAKLGGTSGVGSGGTGKGLGGTKPSTGGLAKKTAPAKAPAKQPSAASRAGAGKAGSGSLSQKRPSTGIGSASGARPSALGGLGSGSATRAASARGASSRGTGGGSRGGASLGGSRAGGGASRGGGGASRGGGGGGRRR
jgi:hypothetical protein